MHPFLLTKPTEASKSQKNDSKFSTKTKTIAEILTSNSVGTQLFFLGCDLDKNLGSNFITKKKIFFVLPEKEISNHRN